MCGAPDGYIKIAVNGRDRKGVESLTMASLLTYLTGDATEPQVQDGVRIIAHCCNDLGLWGSGFVLAVSDKWKEPEEAYLGLSQYKLGYTQFVQVEEDPETWVANIIGQHKVGRWHGLPPIRYEALRRGFEQAVTFSANRQGVSLHLPRIGSARAGGDWSLIEGILEQTVIHAGIPTYVYSLPGQTATNGGWFDARVPGSNSSTWGIMDYP
jgi:hypothetical protein